MAISVDEPFSSG